MKIKLEPWALEPTRAHDTDAGLDLYTPIDFFIKPGGRWFIVTGVHVELPQNTVGYIRSKSGLLKNKGIITDGVIDEGYTGAIGVTLINTSRDTVSFNKGDKIAQLVVQPVLYESVEIVNSLNKAERGNRGFGSTGV